jgi:hypothetical protein
VKTHNILAMASSSMSVVPGAAKYGDDRPVKDLAEVGGTPAPQEAPAGAHPAFGLGPK